MTVAAQEAQDHKHWGFWVMYLLWVLLLWLDSEALLLYKRGFGIFRTHHNVPPALEYGFCFWELSNINFF